MSVRPSGETPLRRNAVNWESRLSVPSCRCGQAAETARLTIPPGPESQRFHAAAPQGLRRFPARHAPGPAGHEARHPGRRRGRPRDPRGVPLDGALEPQCHALPPAPHGSPSRKRGTRARSAVRAAQQPPRAGSSAASPGRPCRSTSPLPACGKRGRGSCAPLPVPADTSLRDRDPAGRRPFGEGEARPGRPESRRIRPGGPDQACRGTDAASGTAPTRDRTRSRPPLAGPEQGLRKSPDP